ncbi:hypothetical protein J6590_027701 [Homalodisca vitripennis]|nr:hypothetical protein J6590_027701 [Homalodisca vitripennis]
MKVLEMRSGSVGMWEFKTLADADGYHRHRHRAVVEYIKGRVRLRSPGPERSEGPYPYTGSPSPSARSLSHIGNVEQSTRQSRAMLGLSQVYSGSRVVVMYSSSIYYICTMKPGIDNGSLYRNRDSTIQKYISFNGDNEHGDILQTGTSGRTMKTKMQTQSLCGVSKSSSST